MSQYPPPLPEPSNSPAPSPAAAYAPSINPGPLNAGLLPHRAGTIFALGIISLCVNLLVFCAGALSGGYACVGAILPIALGIPAWIMANTDLRLMNEGKMDPTGRSQTTTGKVCAIISLTVSTLALVVFVLAILGVLAVLGLFAHHAANP